jgi:hypothetical protein
VIVVAIFEDVMYFLEELYKRYVKENATDYIHEPPYDKQITGPKSDLPNGSRDSFDYLSSSPEID